MTKFIRVKIEGRDASCSGCAMFTTALRCNVVDGVHITDTSKNCFSMPDGSPGASIWKEAPVTCKMSSHKAEYRARSNDPATSKGKCKVNKYEQAVIALLDCEPHGPQNVGLTGKEMALYTGHPLNCITPRFAPLRRKGLIKDSGVRRDKQIVWVLA